MKILKNTIVKTLEIIFPNHCLSCENIINKEGLFCNDCWLKLKFITEPKCPICSYPFEFQGLANLCIKCITTKPSFDKTITIFRYNYILKKIIGSFKYYKQTIIAKKFAKILFQKAKLEIENCDIIIPVPLHKKRLQKRNFNQSALLAKNLAKYSKKEIFLDFLIRVKNTKPQVELKKKDREVNLKNAFDLNKKYQEKIKNKIILLVDDVMTTGATLEECSKVLKKYGAKKVVNLTIAKTATW